MPPRRPRPTDRKAPLGLAEQQRGHQHGPRVAVHQRVVARKRLPKGRLLLQQGRVGLVAEHRQPRSVLTQVISKGIMLVKRLAKKPLGVLAHSTGSPHGVRQQKR